MLYSVLWCVSLIPMKVLYLLSDFVSWLLHSVIGYRRKVVHANLTSAFPEKEAHEIAGIERRFYSFLIDYAFETVKLMTMGRRSMKKRLRVENVEFVDRAVAEGRSVTLLLGHYCNWEWVPAITHHFNEPKICAQIYKPLRDKPFDRLMLRVRSRFNALNIPQNQALRTLFSLSRQGSFIVGILDDHSPNHGRSHHYMEFLNHPGTIINVGAEEIGRRIGAKYLYLDVEKLSRGHYRMTFKPIVITDHFDDYPVSHQYMRMLEETIRRQPPYWLWSHKRWRYTMADLQKEEDTKQASETESVVNDEKGK